MKILYDYQTFQLQNFGGISRYFVEIIQQINKIDGHAGQLALKYTDNIYLDKAAWDIEPLKKNQKLFQPFSERFQVSSIGVLSKTTKAINNLSPTIANKNQVISALKKGQFDVFHPTYYDNYFLPYLDKKPFVLTVYDMTHELFPKLFKFYDYTSAHKRKLVEKAAIIIAISENTKQDLVRLFEVSPEKIEVIPLASSISDSSFIMDKAGQDFVQTLPTNYILYVGKRDVYKNFTRFIEAIHPVLTKMDIDLVCIGKPFSKEEQNLLKSKGILDRTTTMKVTDQELMLSYQHALTFVFPSIYEGFGLPILEAFAAKCPVVASDNSSLPEVGGEAAIYFDPTDVEDMRFKIQKVVGDEALRTKMVKMGIERLKLFSWEATAKKTIKVYQSLSVSN